MCRRDVGIILLSAHALKEKKSMKAQEFGRQTWEVNGGRKKDFPKSPLTLTSLTRNPNITLSVKFPGLSVC